MLSYAAIMRMKYVLQRKKKQDLHEDFKIQYKKNRTGSIG